MVTGPEKCRAICTSWHLIVSKRIFFKGLVECRNLSYIWTISVFEEFLVGYQSTVWHLICGWTVNRKGAMWKVINTNEHIQRQKMRVMVKKQERGTEGWFQIPRTRKRSGRGVRTSLEPRQGEKIQRRRWQWSWHIVFWPSTLQSHRCQMWCRGHHTPK